MPGGFLSGAPGVLLVFARVAGMLGMNPLFARRNLPAMTRAGLTLLMTLLLAPAAAPAAGPMGSLDLAAGMLQELFVGFACGFVFQIFYYMLFFAGDFMDVQFGLSMAKVFDPGTSIQMSVSGNLLNLLFMLYLFATDSHLLLIRIFATSFWIVPAGGVSFSPQAARFFLELFASVFSLALRLALPFVAAEFVLELAMGVLMKLIPQIHVFVINIQFKLLLGILLLLAFSAPVASFLDNYMDLMFQNIEHALFMLA